MSGDRYVDLPAELVERLEEYAEARGMSPADVMDLVFPVEPLVAPRSDFLRHERTRRGERLSEHGANRPKLESAESTEPELTDEVITAERDAALDALSALLEAFQRLGREFSTPKQQRALSEARAIVAASGRRVP